jgi:hypothetical protein
MLYMETWERLKVVAIIVPYNSDRHTDLREVWFESEEIADRRIF